MAINEFNIKCRILKITQLSKKQLIRKISFTLKEDGYNITKTTHSEIEFELINNLFSGLRGISSQKISGCFDNYRTR